MSENEANFKIQIQKVNELFIASSPQFPDCLGKGLSEINALEQLTQTIIKKMDTTISQSLSFLFNQDQINKKAADLLESGNQENSLDFIKRIFGGKTTKKKEHKFLEIDITLPISNTPVESLIDPAKANQYLEAMSHTQVLNLRPTNIDIIKNGSKKTYFKDKLFIDAIDTNNIPLKNLKDISLGLPFSIN